MHSWKQLPDTNDEGIPIHKEWICIKCGCLKTLGQYKFATTSYQRSSINYDKTPECCDMGRRSNEPLD